MKYLVLGSSGQVGSALVDWLQSKNEEVLTFDIAEDSVFDLRIPNRVDTLVEQADFVFFLAFDVGGSSYLKTYQNTYQFIDNNTRIMTNTFSALKQFNKPFIFASSQMSNMSFSSYGVLKSLGEHYTRVLGGTTVKFWNVYGIENDPKKTHVITDFVKMALKNGVIKMKTDGQEERQFLYSVDCSEALHLLSKQHESINKENLHITSFEWVKILDIAYIIADTIGNVSVVPAEQKDTVQQGKRNEADPYILSLWQPKTKIIEGIRNIINHYKQYE